MSVIDICNAALKKTHVHETIPDTVDWLNPVGKSETVCAEFRDQARRAALRLGPWSCITTRKRLASAKWSALTVFTAGSLIVAGTQVFICQVGGISAAIEPTWPATGTVADAAVTWAFLYQTRAPYPAENFSGLTYASPLPANYLMLRDVTDSSGSRVHFVMESGILYTSNLNPILVYIRDEEDDTLYDALLRDAVILETAIEICVPLTDDEGKKNALMQEIAMLSDSAFSKTKREHQQGIPASEPWKGDLFETRYP